MMHREGEVAIVTGASGGIDRAVTERLGCDGATTVNLKSTLVSAQKATPSCSEEVRENADDEIRW